MKIMTTARLLAGVATLTGCATLPPAPRGNPGRPRPPAAFYLPGTEAGRSVTVSTNGPATADVLVQTQRVAVKERGPKETVARFGEAYAFAPNFFAVRRDEPTRIRFWNLPPDDQHAFLLFAPDSRVLPHAPLPPLTETGFVFTFHTAGLYRFACSLHPNAIFGRILVLPPAGN